MTAYYNEIDPYAAAWLRNLIAAGHIAAGDVDERSILDVRPDDLVGYDQCHFFAGIGGWSLALRLAGWPDDRKCWTGSCPCQPFSAAGKGAGFDDARHLWPTWFDLIGECRPGVVFGEQVASKDGLMWLDLVHADMERADYAFAAFDLCSAGFGAPHIRQRLGFVADRAESGRNEQPIRYDRANWWPTPELRRLRDVGGLADSHDARSQGRGGRPERADQCAVGALGMAGGMADTERGSAEFGRYDVGSASRALEGGTQERERFRSEFGAGCDVGERPGPTNGVWRDADWLLCRDGKWRPVEPGTFPLAHGISGRVGRLRAYGNAINPWQFAALIEAYCDTVLPGVKP